MGDPRWEFGDPPQGNANFAWLQHMLYHLKPTGRAGIVLANGSMSSTQNSEGGGSDGRFTESVIF